MIRIAIIVFPFLLSWHLSVEGSRTVDRILEQLEKKGFSNALSSEDNFEKTIKCEKCSAVVQVAFFHHYEYEAMKFTDMQLGPKYKVIVTNANDIISLLKIR